MLHRFGHGLLVILVACLCLMPARAEAAPIVFGPVSSGTFSFSGDFVDVDENGVITFRDDGVALIYLSLLDSAVLTVAMTSHLQLTNPGFDPILTLFGETSDGTGDFLFGGYKYLFEASDGFIQDLDFDIPGYLQGGMLAAGNYVLALTQVENYYVQGLGFMYEGVPDFTSTWLYGVGTGTDGSTCTSFVGWMGDCRTPNFAGTLTIELDNVQPVPEPGSLTLLALGGAALLARRDRWRRRKPSSIHDN